MAVDTKYSTVGQNQIYRVLTSACDGSPLLVGRVEMGAAASGYINSGFALATTTKAWQGWGTRICFVLRTLAAGGGTGRRAGGWRSGRSGRSGGCSAIAGFGLDFGFVRSGGVRSGCGRLARSLGLLGSAFAGVVIHIPSGALETQRGRGHRADQDSVAFRAFALRFGAEILDLFKAVAARSAAIFIEWQVRSSK